MVLELVTEFRDLKKELTLAENFTNKFDDEIITIDCPNLQSLTLCPDSPRTFIVSAPNLSYLKFRSSHVTGFSAEEGFPCIKQVHIVLVCD